MAKRVIFGATSAIAVEVARLFASNADDLLLIARNSEKLEILRKDLLVRGASVVEVLKSDLACIESHQELLSKIDRIMPDYDTAFFAYGILGDQVHAQKSFEATKEILDVNFISVLSLITSIANHFEQIGSGVIAVICSVAGDRGRRSNYIYGTTKGALDIFLQGLRNRLSFNGVSVVTFKLGFVDTPMTANIKKNFMFASPEYVAKGIFKAINKRKNVVYLPAVWRFIMLGIKFIPECLFKKQKYI